MRLRSLLATVSTVLLAAIAALVLMQAVEAQTDPPASGDWTVADATVVEDRTVDLLGNLTVASGGDLTLRNVTLRVQSLLTITHGIRVASGGNLTIEDADGDADTTSDRSVVMRGAPARGYYFVVEAGASLVINRSLVSGAGAPSSPSAGVLVRANGTYVGDSVFLDGHEYGLRVEGCSKLYVTHSYFARAQDGLALRDVENSRIMDSTFFDNRRNGIYLYNSSMVLIDTCNSSSNTLRGLHARMGRYCYVWDSYFAENVWGLVLDGVKESDVRACHIEETSLDGMSVLPGTRDLEIAQTYIHNSTRTGIMAEGVDNVTIDHTYVINSTYFGIRVEGGSENINIQGSGVWGNGYDGVHVERTRNIRITSSTFHDNGYYGVFLVDCGNVSIEDCTLYGNDYDGLNCDTVNGLSADGLTIFENLYNGLQLQAGSMNISIGRSSMLNNSRAGAVVDSVRNVTLRGCKVTGNLGEGVSVEGGASGIHLDDCVLSNNTESALAVDRSHSVYVSGGRLNSSGASGSYAVDAARSGYIWLLNTSVSGTLRARLGSNITWVDPPDESNTTSVDVGSWIDISFWVTIQVVWPDMDPVAGATVTATSVDGNRTWGRGTDSAGTTALVPTTELTLDGVNLPWVVRSPWTFRATKSDETASVRSWISSNKVLTIVLHDDVPPVAVAHDVVAELGFETRLDGSDSRDNGEIATWEWTFDDGVGTVVLEGEVVAWTFPRLGTFAGRLNVTDRVGLYTEVTFNITVVDTTPPDVVVGGNVTVDQNDPVDLDGTNTTDNDSTLITTGKFMWSIFEAEGPTLLGSREGPYKAWSFAEMGLYMIMLEVTDQSDNAGNATFWVTVRDTTPPVVDLGPDLEVDQGTLVVIEPTMLFDNDPLFPQGAVFEWTLEGPGLPSTPFASPTFNFTPLEMGEYTVVVRVTDGSGNTAQDRLVVTSIDSTAPVVSAGPDATVDMGSEASLSGAATVDNDPAFPTGAIFRWTVTGPRLDIALNGAEVSFVPPWVGEYTCVLTVTDAAGNAGSDAVVVMSVDTSPPLFGDFSPGPDELQDLQLVNVTLVVIDAGAGIDPESVEMRMLLPGTGGEWLPWSKWEGAGGGNRVTLSGERLFGLGTTRLQFRVRDLAGNGPTISPEYEVRVNSPPVAVLLSPSNNADYGPFEVVTLDASGSYDPDEEDDLGFVWWSSIDGSIGFTERMPAPRLTPGEHRIVLTVSDGVTGHEVTAEVNITVRPVPSTVSDEEFPWVWVLVLVLAIIVLAVVVHSARRRARKPHEPRGEEGDQEPMDDTGEGRTTDDG